MCGRCTRRDAGTSSLLETASVSNMRTSWVREGSLVYSPQHPSLLSFYPKETLNLTSPCLTEPEHSLDFSLLPWCRKKKQTKKKIIHFEFRYTKHNFKKAILRRMTDDWTFRVCASKSSSLLPKIVTCHDASFMQILLLILIHIAFSLA